MWTILSISLLFQGIDLRGDRAIALGSGADAPFLSVVDGTIQFVSRPKNSKREWLIRSRDNGRKIIAMSFNRKLKYLTVQDEKLVLIYEENDDAYWILNLKETGDRLTSIEHPSSGFYLAMSADKPTLVKRSDGIVAKLYEPKLVRTKLGDESTRVARFTIDLLSP